MIAALLASVCLLTCLGQISQKLAVESWRGRQLSLPAKLFSPWLVLAIACLGGSLLLWLVLLQHLDVGVAYPMLSLNFVLVTLAAGVLFHERIDLRHWCGVALIVAGVALLGLQS
ncbi:4-amino-4-deoxy-L-arabinose-phosphoundecaprenol flippase subunit ArnE [Pseudomonas sp. ZM23]|uniref:Probable 4-amino-4-deoxy-L-arabinose-phosphoundecaprenol flippase subunit ArnE n=1 Tax=Pseudomonas triclosanedens TaxID=2961893 RepID=A0ABY7A2Z6_9PSED|nr:4-amino-4-deoxy-L-arabinose-phosphoundecaprenol flippase subunit ArnE [Pseudomonas triclosanedens]MCP8463824.1 4-amino-4-deoxy-L-arabinose-phosphoundecaprenol flippase subunit ArnE [Pseudomonas triclosanedens]MCP8468908.1 4-amino-4-deoxy-L-arabinose-phosphoundecaprenol flippase subunit ArnE [Pseudomonas triclosanedens]MCP8475630.1 4-amino-4-deoxy-L-arabinose-phosphoundecaprenol flippase subunit ArnE [Pseudomonas triclosanedens]WAI50655.1 4-amino-4-deoxy-L-arabinose-phosphoundecaprenol flippa